MNVPAFLVDAFTDRPFAGNPAVVCLLAAWREDGWQQNVAREMNQSETAFLVKSSEGFDLRWFTPAVEVDLCGHATLASAHVIWQERLAGPGDDIHFSTRSGILKAARRGDQIELDFPLIPQQPEAAPAGLAEAVGARFKYVGKGRFDYLVEVESEAALRSLKPDFRRLATIPVRGLIATSRANDPRYDFISRFFAPAAGIDEDPVTGSAHCCLADYWRKQLGKSEFLAYQASARRGIVRVRIDGERVFLGGQAVTVMRSEMFIED
jgi:PhzF family phenazine biosynthesis protein